MVRTGVLSDEMRARVEPLLPSWPGRPGRPFRDHPAGARGGAVPAADGRDGTWDAVLTRLLTEADAAGELDWAVSVDSTCERISTAPVVVQVAEAVSDALDALDERVRQVNGTGGAGGARRTVRRLRSSWRVRSGRVPVLHRREGSRARHVHRPACWWRARACSTACCARSRTTARPAVLAGDLRVLDRGGEVVHSGLVVWSWRRRRRD